MAFDLAPATAAASASATPTATDSVASRALRVLQPSELEHLHREGYVVVANVLSPDVLASLLTEYSGVLSGLVTERKLRNEYADLPLGQRLIAVSKESGLNFPQRFDCSLPQGGIKADTPLSMGPAVFRTITNARLLDLVADVLGTDEITSNPVQHDNAVVLPEADHSDILTIWMPLSESTLTNGVMQVIPRSHLQALQQHCHTREGLAIPPSALDPALKAAAISLPMSAGSALLMTHRTIHKSLENSTHDDVRSSMDLRFQRTGTPSGRPVFASASFVARSLQHPERVLRDPQSWAQNWFELRKELAEQEEDVANKQATAATAA